jgi:hypothetical protein
MRMSPLYRYTFLAGILARIVAITMVTMAVVSMTVTIRSIDAIETETHVRNGFPERVHHCMGNTAEISARLVAAVLALSMMNGAIIREKGPGSESGAVRSLFLGIGRILGEIVIRSTVMEDIMTTVLEWIGSTRKKYLPRLLQ